MTIFDEVNSYIVRQFFIGDGEPSPPALSILYRRTEPARLVDAALGQYLKTNFYDPNISVSPPTPPASYPGELNEIHERIVRYRHDGVAPIAPDLGIPLKAGLTEVFDPDNDKKYTLYRYSPNETPAPIGDAIAFGDGEMMAFGDDEIFAFGAP